MFCNRVDTQRRSRPGGIDPWSVYLPSSVLNCAAHMLSTARSTCELEDTVRQPHAIIVGFGPGNGVGIAKAFAGERFALSLLARSPEKQLDPLRALEALGATAEVFAADAARADSLRAGIQQAVERFGTPEVLIYNVAVPTMGKPSAVDPAALSTDFVANVAGALVATQAVLPGMLARKSGTILFTGGSWALQPVAQFTSLSVSKAALRALTFTLAEELQGSGVRAGTVTIFGAVRPGGDFDPLKIGRAFLSLYREPDASFPIEVQFRGS